MDVLVILAKKLDIQIGDVVEIGGRRYDVVSDKSGGVTLEPAISLTIDQLHADRGGKPLPREEFDELLGQLPTDDEG